MTRVGRAIRMTLLTLSGCLAITITLFMPLSAPPWKSVPRSRLGRSGPPVTGLGTRPRG